MNITVKNVKKIHFDITDPYEIDQVLMNTTFNELCNTATDIAVLRNDAQNRELHLDLMKKMCSIEDVIAYIKKSLQSENVPLRVEIG
jgi:hypothetical protein